MSKYRFFAYDPETGFETFETADQAKKHAEECIQCYRDEAGEGWDEQTDQVCWGEVKGKAVQVNQSEPSNIDNGFDYYCDYSLLDITDEPVQEQKA